MKRFIVCLAVWLAGTACMNAEVRLPHILGSHMVLQRQQPIHLWGWANPGESVTAALNEQTQSAVADAMGHWNIYLPAMNPGGPYQLTIKGVSALTLDDVMVGDVWFASGQSNMEMPLKGFCRQRRHQELRRRNP